MRCQVAGRTWAVGCVLVVTTLWTFGLHAQTAEKANAAGESSAGADEWSKPFDFRPANVQVAEFADAIVEAIKTAKKAGKVDHAQAWQTRLDALNKRREDAVTGEKSDRAELHVVGLYEGDYILEKGHKRADGTRVRGVANVHVTHAAAPVVLALSSYEPVMWDVRVDKGVQLKKVIVSSYYGSDAAAPKDVPVVGARPADDEGHGWHVHDKRRAEFQRAATELRTQTGLEIRTFQGKYAPKTHEFVIGPQGETWRDEYLLTRYEALARDSTADARAAILKRLDEIRFEAPLFASGGRHFDSGAVSFGLFSGRGPISDTVEPLPEKCGRVVRDVVSGDWYALANNGLARFAPAAKGGKAAAAEAIPLGLGLPELSHPRGLALDTRRRRVLLATLGGVGHLYAYDIADKSWSLLGELGNRDLCALAYDAKSDTILGLQAEYDAGGINKAVKLNAKGGAVGEIEFVPPIVNGNEHGHGVDVFATVVDDWILTITSNAADRAANELGTITVVDSNTGRGLLARTLRPQKDARGVDLKTRDRTKLKAEQERLRAEIERLTRDAKAVEERIDGLDREEKPE